MIKTAPLRRTFSSKLPRARKYFLFEGNFISTYTPLNLGIIQIMAVILLGSKTVGWPSTKMKCDRSACRYTCGWNSFSPQDVPIVHFTVVCLVTWPLSGSEAGDDLALIKTFLLFTCKSCCYHANICCYHANIIILCIYTWKAGGFVSKRGLSVSISSFVCNFCE